MNNFKKQGIQNRSVFKDCRFGNRSIRIITGITYKNLDIGIQRYQEVE